MGAAAIKAKKAKQAAAKTAAAIAAFEVSSIDPSRRLTICYLVELSNCLLQ